MRTLGLSSTSGPTVGAEVLRALVAAVEGAGASRERYLQTIGLSEASLNQSRFALQEVIGFCERALEVTGDPALALHWGEGLSATALGPISQLVAQASTLRRGLEMMAEFEQLIHDERTFEVLEGPSRMRIRMTGSQRYTPAMARFVAEMMLAAMLTTVRSFSARAQPLAARFSYAPPTHRAEYLRIFGGAVSFDQAVTELEFESALLDRASPHGDVEVHAALKTVAEQRLLRLTRSAPYALRLRQHLLARTPRLASMATAARELGLSVRSLRRKLTLEGTSYREIENAVLRVLVTRLLCERGLTIQETAYEMGFSDVTTFHRAFKSWTSLTPSAFRAQAIGREPY